VISITHVPTNYSLCSLDFNIHQLILSDLAASVGASNDDPADPTIDSSIDAIRSNVTTRAVSEIAEEDESVTEANLEQRVFMVSVPAIVPAFQFNLGRQSASRARCNIGFSELSVNMSPSLLHSTVPVLLDVLRDIPYIDFDMNLTWDGKHITPANSDGRLKKFHTRLVFT
jgi:phosphatidylinositol 4-kinase